MHLNNLAAIKRACQPGARLAILTTDQPRLEFIQEHGPRRIAVAQTNAIAVRGAYRSGGRDFDPDILCWIYWPTVSEIEFHGDDSFTLTGIARYRILPGACERCERLLQGHEQTLCQECESQPPAVAEIEQAAPAELSQAEAAAVSALIQSMRTGMGEAAITEAVDPQDHDAVLSAIAKLQARASEPTAGGDDAPREPTDRDVALAALVQAPFTASLDVPYTPDPDRDGDPFRRVAEEFDGDLKDPGATWALRVSCLQSGESRLIDTSDWRELDAEQRTHNAA